MHLFDTFCCILSGALLSIPIYVFWYCIQIQFKKNDLQENRVIWSYQLSWLRKLATVKSFKADVSSVSPLSERMEELWVVCVCL